MEPLSRHLTLFAPGLLAPLQALDALPRAERPACDALATVLSRAQRSPGPALAPDSALFALFGITVADGEDPPVAAVSRLADGGGRDPAHDAAVWLRADPVYAQADRDRAVLLGYEELDLSPGEAGQLVSGINAHFADSGWHLEALHPQRWYLRPGARCHITTRSLHLMMGQSLLEHLPQGKDADYWRGVANEIQMLLHASPVNAERENHGRLPVNSLWLWGTGSLPTVPEGRWASVWGGGPLLQGLAELSGVPRHALPEGGAQWLAQGADAAGPQLAVFDEFLAPALTRDVYESLQRLTAFDRDWLAPLSAALRQGTVQTLSLLAGDGWRYSVSRAQIRRWWRRRRPLRDFVGTAPPP